MIFQLSWSILYFIFFINYIVFYEILYNDVTASRDVTYLFTDPDEICIALVKWPGFILWHLNRQASLKTCYSHRTTSQIPLVASPMKLYYFRHSRQQSSIVKKQKGFTSALLLRETYGINLV